MAAPPFKVKAVYEYRSEHDDDLNFPEAQVITVTDIEDDEWYIGEYTDASGSPKSGLFPKNFVEKFEPAPPPRPTRSRPKTAEAPVEAAQPPAEPEPEPAAGPVSPKPQPGSVQAATEEPEPSAPSPEPAPAVASKPPQAADLETPPAPKPVEAKPADVAPAAKKAPPPVAAKSNAFKDRIAAFNKPAAAPVAPFKPSSASSNFIRKPFVAPPPARDSYVPPPREQAPQKVYRREEDPEIAERKAQDEENARQAGLGGQSHSATGDEGQAPKPIALKDRIAMLQKQQKEQAERQAQAAQKKEKTQRPPKKRTESHEPPAEEEAGLEKSLGEEPTERPSMDSSRELPPMPVRKHSHIATAEPELFSDGGNDADQSAAGETTEDAGGSSTSVEEDDTLKKRHPAAPAREADVGDEEEVDEEDEEEEVDEEQARKDRIRARMAALSGAERGGNVFNPMGFNPMAVGGAPAKKKSAPSKKSPTEEEEQQPTQPTPVPGMRMALPGMGRTKSPEPLGKEADDERPITGMHAPEEVPDVEEVSAAPKRSSTGRSVPPVPSTAPGAAPPVPGGRSSLDSRPVPPPPPAATMSASEGSESDDEMPDVPRDLPLRGASESSTTSAPPVPPGRPGEARVPPQSPHSRPQPPPVPISPRSPAAERGVLPPIPVTSPQASQGRAPPPPPPAGPPSRQHTSESIARHPTAVEDGEGESEYEGDYDTDIASSAKHKDALKAHAREDSLDDSTTTEDASTRSPPMPRAVPPVPVPATRPVPPPPPAEPAGRRSMEGSRALPPMPPPRQAPDDDEYDPYRYSGVPTAAAPRMPPPPTPSGGPPQLPPMSPMLDQDDEEEELYSAPQRRSTDRKALPSGPPPGPHERAPPPPPPSQMYQPPPPPPGSAQPSSHMPGRKSLDADTAMRRSMDQSRPSGDADGGFIARDVDLGQSSRWWAQPNMPPPAFQNRRDIFFEIDESTTSRRGGKTTVSKDVYVLFRDYSKSHINAQFDAGNVDDVQLQQEHGPPPGRLRQDQLEDAYMRFGSRLASMVSSKEGSVVGDGSPQGLVLDLLSQLPGALLPVGTRAYGALVYQNIGNATVAQYDEIRPGDIVSFRNARFQGKHGNLHTKYSQEVGKPDHVGIVAEWDGTKKKIRAWEQGKDEEGGEAEKGKSKKSGKVKVKAESFRLGDLRSGEVRVWRLMGRGWVGWDGD